MAWLAFLKSKDVDHTYINQSVYQASVLEWLTTYQSLESGRFGPDRESDVEYDGDGYEPAAEAELSAAEQPELTLSDHDHDSDVKQDDDSGQLVDK